MKQKIENKVLKILKEGISKIKAVNENTNTEAKETKVIFDKSTQPFEVVYSERGFDINGVRFSFDFLETALSKKVHIALDEGKGLVLDNVRIEKILKYEDLYRRNKIQGDELA